MKTVTPFFAASFSAVQLRRRFLAIAGTSAAVWGLGLGRASAQQRGQCQQAQEAWKCAADLLHGGFKGVGQRLSRAGAYTAADCS